MPRVRRPGWRRVVTAVRLRAQHKRIAPDGAAVQLRRDGELVVATVTARSPLLPGITIAAEAVAAAEPGPR